MRLLKKNKWTDKEEIQKRSAKYSCDGRCYWDTGMCGKAEICDETRKGEFCATVIAVICITPLMIVFWVCDIIETGLKSLWKLFVKDK